MKQSLEIAFLPSSRKIKKPYTEVVTNASDPDSLQVPEVITIKMQTSQPSQI